MSTAATPAIAAVMEQNSAAVLVGECFALSEADAALRTDFPERHILLPAADRSLAGIAFGFAVDGAHPIVRLPDAASLLRLSARIEEQSVLCAANGMSSGVVYELPCSPRDSHRIALLDLQNSSVWAPITPAQTKVILEQALSSDKNTVLLSCLSPDLKTDGEDSEVKPWLTLRQSDTPWATILCWGQACASALAIAAEFASEDCEIDVIALQHLTPDSSTIQQLAERLRDSGRLVSIELPLGAHNALMDEAFWSLESPPQRCLNQMTEIRQALDEALRY